MTTLTPFVTNSLEADRIRVRKERE
ncbi:protein of unknown function [Methylacidimicrobium sp. AP8]|nr:protein of unknown function [Methylacidimicrobium sp. AP8]